MSKVCASVCFCMKMCKCIQKCAIMWCKCVSVSEMHMCVWMRMQVCRPNSHVFLWIPVQVCKENVQLQECMSLCKTECECERGFACCAMLVVGICSSLYTKYGGCERQLHIVSHSLMYLHLHLVSLILHSHLENFHSPYSCVCVSEYVWVWYERLLSRYSNWWAMQSPLLILLLLVKLSMGYLLVSFEHSSSTRIIYSE